MRPWGSISSPGQSSGHQADHRDLDQAHIGPDDHGSHPTTTAPHAERSPGSTTLSEPPGSSRPSRRCCSARPGNVHPSTSAAAGSTRWPISTTGRGPWQRDLRGPAADSSLLVVVVPRSASGSRATSPWMSARRGSARSGSVTRRGHLLSDRDNPRHWPASVGIDWGSTEHQQGRPARRVRAGRYPAPRAPALAGPHSGVAAAGGDQSVDPRPGPACRGARTRHSHG